MSMFIVTAADLEGCFACEIHDHDHRGDRAIPLDLSKFEVKQFVGEVMIFPTRGFSNFKEGQVISL